MSNAGDVEARAALVRLLASADRNGSSVRTLSVKVTPPRDPSPAVHRAWRDRLEATERAGAVRLKRGAGNRREVLERVHLVDADRLAKAVGLVRAGVMAADAVAAARAACAGREGFDDAIDAARRRWERGEDWHRLPADTALVGDVFSAAAGLLDVAFGTHFRTASFQASGSTKFVERNGTAICAILKQALELPADMPRDDVWERLGLVRFSHPVCLRAPAQFHDGAGVIVSGRGLPWSAVCPDIVESCTAEGDAPAFVMTVENWTSFNAQCREIAPGAVVYTNGFPAPAIRALVRRMAEMWAGARFFHWGDVDAGGLLIADSIREAVGREVGLHLMSPLLAAQHGKKSNPLTRVAGISRRDDDFGRLARYLCGDACHTYEQEMLRPLDPLAGDAT